MANPIGGNYQHFLLNGSDNGRPMVQQQRLAPRPAPRPAPRLAPRPASRSQAPKQNSREQTPSGRGTPGFAARRPTPATRSPSSINTSLGSRPLTTPHPATPIPATWSSRTSLTMFIKPMPLDVSPWHIRQFFERFGNVVWVEFDDRGSCRSARVRFEPPPTDSSFVQQGKCKLELSGSEYWCFVDFPKRSPEEPNLTTPLGNNCPMSMSIKLDTFTFGLLTQPTTFMPKKEIFKLDGNLEMKFTADFRRKKLVIHFPLLVHNKERQYYRLDIRFGIVKNIYRVNTGGGRSAVVILLHDPPLVRKKQRASDGEAWADRLVWGEDELWHRVVEVKSDIAIPKTEPVSLDKAPNTIDFGRWTTYLMDLTKPTEEQWSAIETHLRDWNVKTKLDVDFTRVPDRKPELWDMLADSHSGMTAANNPWNNSLALLSPMTHIVLPYGVRYQLEVCISHGILSEYNISRGFLARLLELSVDNDLKLNRAQLVLEYAADQGVPIHDPMSLFEDRGAMSYYPPTIHIPSYCALVRKVTITPTRIYFNTPTVETTNRVVRRYKHVHDHFIRVQFTDELLEGRIRSSEVDRDIDLFTRVYRVMMGGIRMGRWHWKLLAYGNSQIRECGAFYFCEPDDRSVTCEDIRQWMGNFDQIKTLAKYAARLGQCFSTTRLLHSIAAPSIVKIDDIERDGFCYTDGVGKISQTLTCFIGEDWNMTERPSAVQFRMGGCKGVLVEWPDAKGTEVHVRPSQEKFSAVYNGLEIIRCSQFSSATLNRQTIMILSCLGVPDEVFIDMMATQIANYNAAMTDPDKAVEMLSSHVDENMTTTTIASMILSGFMHTREPFVRTLLQLWRFWSIKALKEKARLIVDEGAFVLGCVDETGTLRGHSKRIEGKEKISQDELPQIFLQVPDPKNRGAYKVITGLCIVGRNPSLHPGDIRVVEAVDVPALHHLRDVVAFPLKGDRDIPSMCSGGDLDGDDFFVIWDPRLLPTEWDHPPMNYTAPKPLIEPRASTAKGLATFFVLFMKNDRLPLIAHAHLATADYEAEGAKHRKCLQLAQLHSTAVDYVKTGVPAEWNKRLDPRKFPHFMEKAPGKTYRSNGVLGQLYDMVERTVFDNAENYKLPFDDRIRKRYPDNNDMLKAARKIKSQYDIAMRRVMGQLEIKTEFEAWTTFVTTKPRVGSDYKVQEKVGRETAGLKKQFRDMCLGVIEEQHFDRLEFVAAMYKVTWEETRIALHEARQPHMLPDGTVGLRRVSARSMPLISFPWLFPTEMGRIALGTEQLPNLEELGIVLPSTKSRPKGAGGNAGGPVQLEEEVIDLQGMEYTKTSDGQYIHRGETLQLFRHDDGNGEDGFYCSEELLGPLAGNESVSPGASVAPDDSRSPTTNGESDGGFPDLLDLGASLDGEGGASSGSDAASSSTSQETMASNEVARPAQLTGYAADLAGLDLLSSDMDAAPELLPWLVPTKVSTAPRQNAVTVAEPAGPVNGSCAGLEVPISGDNGAKEEAGTSKLVPEEVSKTVLDEISKPTLGKDSKAEAELVKTPTEQSNPKPKDISFNKTEMHPTVSDFVPSWNHVTTPAPAPAAAPDPDLDAPVALNPTVSGFTPNWNRLTTPAPGPAQAPSPSPGPATDPDLDTPVELIPIEYLTLRGSAGLGSGSYSYTRGGSGGASTAAKLAARVAAANGYADLWGDDAGKVNGSGKVNGGGGGLKADESGATKAAAANGYVDLWGNGNGNGLGLGGGGGGGREGGALGLGPGESQVEGQGHGKGPDLGLGSGLVKGLSDSQVQDMSWSQGNGQTDTTGITKNETAAKDGESGESDGEVEYEEDAIEVEAETVLEKAARLA